MTWLFFSFVALVSLTACKDKATPEFATTFACKRDAPMVRANRCQVW
jgi:hypothetical protein